jgi:hypothetical protein
MARIYANLIEKKIKTIDQVPTKYKERTLEILKQDGYDGYGEPLA